MLVYQGLKPATKDIDLIISNKQPYERFVIELKKIGFTPKNPTGVYIKMHASMILERSDFRLDIFLETVCKRLKLSKKMMQRAQSIISGNYLDVFHCSNEDIFLFKSMTERDGDLEDCISLAKRGLNWPTILTEMQSQIKQNGEDIWITWIGERFDLLEEKGLHIPIINEIDALRNTYFNMIEKKYLEKK